MKNVKVLQKYKTFSTCNLLVKKKTENRKQKKVTNPPLFIGRKAGPISQLENLVKIHTKI